MGLAKYHLFFAGIAIYTLLYADPQLRRAVLALNAFNFLCDDGWAAAHLHWIKEGPIVLFPQASLVAWLAWLAY